MKKKESNKKKKEKKKERKEGRKEGRRRENGARSPNTILMLSFFFLLSSSFSFLLLPFFLHPSFSFSPDIRLFRDNIDKDGAQEHSNPDEMNTMELIEYYGHSVEEHIVYTR